MEVGLEKALGQTGNRCQGAPAAAGGNPWSLKRRPGVRPMTDPIPEIRKILGSHMSRRYLAFCAEQYQDDPAGLAGVLARHANDERRKAGWDFIARAVQLRSA